MEENLQSRRDRLKSASLFTHGGEKLVKLIVNLLGWLPGALTGTKGRIYNQSLNSLANG